MGLGEEDRLRRASLLRRARGGELDALHRLGTVYSNGAQGVKKCPARAKVFFRRAARCGHADSQALLADLLVREEHWTEAFAWFSRAAEGGSVFAQMALYEFFLAGMVVEADAEQAFEWLDRAAASGALPAVEEAARTEEFILTDVEFNREAGLPENLVVPIRRRTSWHLGSPGVSLYGEMLADLRRYMVRYPVAGYEFFEQLQWLEEQAMEPAGGPFVPLDRHRRQ